ncbi:hypothetical protein [Mycobacterium intracellulare]|uniref:hypothetical protein n=1 Tax=Mycobacterium intracellulare TaxID=1767 RepID=UPI000C7A32D6|nr:hypothetical protein [Mycobacterium intracellulare]
MSYDYSWTGELLCDGCGTTNHVAKRALCPYATAITNGHPAVMTLPICPPTPLCPSCYTDAIADDEFLTFMHSECANTDSF